jgi:hypothetical protein
VVIGTVLVDVRSAVAVKQECAVEDQQVNSFMSGRQDRRTLTEDHEVNLVLKFGDSLQNLWISSIKVRVEIPIDANAPGKAPVTSARPPVLTIGNNSDVADKIFNGASVRHNC